MNLKSLCKDKKYQSVVVLILTLLILTSIFVMIYKKPSEQKRTEDKMNAYKSQLIELAQRLDEDVLELEKTGTLQEFHLTQEKLRKLWLKKSETIKQSLASEDFDTLLFVTLITVLEEYRSFFEMGQELELYMGQVEKEVYTYISQGVITSIEYNQGLEQFLTKYHHETQLENMEAAFLGLQPISENDQKVHQLMEGIFVKLLEYEKNKIAIHFYLQNHNLKLESFEEGCRAYLIKIFSENNDENDIDD